MIDTPINNLKQEKSNERLSEFVKGFYIRRFCRIYPVALLVYCLVLISVIAFHFFGYKENILYTLKEGLAIFTFSYNYFYAYHHDRIILGPYWSLSIEEQFYLFLPFFLIITKTTRQRVLFLVSGILLTTFYLRPTYLTTQYMEFLSQVRWDGLMYGCLIFYFIQKTNFKNILMTNKYRYVKIFFTLFLVFLLVIIPWIISNLSISLPLIYLISSVLVASAALEKDIIISFSWVQKFLDYCGSRSYCLYLTHVPMYYAAKYLLKNFNSYPFLFVILSSIILGILFTAVLSELLHRYIEQPFIAKGRIWSASR